MNAPSVTTASGVTTDSGVRPEATARPGWEAELRLGYQKRTDKTRLIDSKRRGPLAVQRAFYPEGDVCHTYLLHPPGGVVGGDQLEVKLKVADQARVLLTTPGATKFYRSLGATSSLNQTLYVEAGGALEWMPLENIFFPGTRSRLKTEVHLSQGALFMGWEINCLGRPANKERFELGTINANLRVYRDGTPILFDRFATEGLSLVDAPVGLRGASAQATFIATLDDPDLVEQVQAYLEEHLEEQGGSSLGGATLIDGLLCVRLIGEQSQKFLKILVGIWTLIRPTVMNIPACAPRIWAT